MITEKTTWPFPQIEPREVQLEALEAAKGKPGFAYFMRQRLGKTWTAYAEFYNLREVGEVDWCIVICPNSIKLQWQQAIEQVDPYTPICIYSSQSKAKTNYFFKKNKTGGVFIINYEGVKAFMREAGWQKIDPLKTYIVVDESTKIKEPKTEMAKACHELGSICSVRRVLTGKPTANSNADVWSQLKFIGATDRNYYQHKYYFCVVGGYQGRQVKRNINTEQLKQEMAPFCYIAPDKYIKGFEKVYEPLRFVQFSGEQLRMYQEMEKSLILELQGGGIQITAPIALVKYLRLQQISSGIAGDVDGKQHNIIDPERNPRIGVVREILENEVSNKVIIPCRFKLSIDNLYQVLSKRGFRCQKLIGGMSLTQIEDAKRKFNEEDYDVLLSQLQVLSFGHTLPGNDKRPCDSMIFYENDFSLINRAQCESRPEKVDSVAISYYDMYASEMDKYIIEAILRKEDGAMALMGYARKYGINIGDGVMKGALW